DRVAMTVFIRDRHEDVERRRRQRQECFNRWRGRVGHESETIATLAILSTAIDDGRSARDAMQDSTHAAAVAAPGRSVTRACILDWIVSVIRSASRSTP